MNADEIVIGEVQRKCGFQVLSLFREADCQPCESSHGRSDVQVLSFNVRRTDALRIRIATGALVCTPESLRANTCARPRDREAVYKSSQAARSLSGLGLRTAVGLGSREA